MVLEERSRLLARGLVGDSGVLQRSGMSMGDCTSLKHGPGVVVGVKAKYGFVDGCASFRPTCFDSAKPQPTTA